MDDVFLQYLPIKQLNNFRLLVKAPGKGKSKRGVPVTVDLHPRSDKCLALLMQMLVERNHVRIVLYARTHLVLNVKYELDGADPISSLFFYQKSTGEFRILKVACKMYIQCRFYH